MKIKMKRLLLFSLFFFVTTFMPLFFAWSAEFGAVLKGEFDAAGADETKPGGSIILAPWILFPFEKAELYISAGFNAKIADKSYFAPELFQLYFFMPALPGKTALSFKVGRFAWQDATGFIAKGSFDGADILFTLGKINLGVNALYTGFLFKDSAEINVSPTDKKDYSANFKWSEFQDTYSAPRRLLTSLYGEFPGFPLGRGRSYAGFIAQFDLCGATERFSTQYLLLRHIFSVKTFDLNVSGALEFENTKADGVRPAFAFSLEGGYQLPTAIADRLSLGLSWSSGETSGTGAFFPVTKEARSFVLKPVLCGMMIINANYHARFIPSLSMELGGSYFIRTDVTSFTAPSLNDDAYPLGLELNASVLWVPLSDLSFSFKGGAFLPQTGSAWTDNAPVLWRITLGTVFSF